MKLSVVIPTVGRESLQAALSSCKTADQIVVVADHANGPVQLPDLPANVTVADVVGGDHGYTARTAGIAQATGTHLAFLDDDDIYTDGAIDLMRQAACDQPVVFRMDHYDHGILWRTRTLEFGNVSTQMILVPNQPDKLGVWAPHMPGLKEPGGDYTFLAGCVERMGGPIWRNEIVATLRPHLPTVAIVTPWLNHPEFLDNYQAAVSVRHSRDQLIVVDNGSDPPIDLPGIRLEQNTGFSRACNIGLGQAVTDTVLFLNNDVRATDPGWLDKLAAAVEPGVLAGANLRYDPHGAVDDVELPYLDGWCLAGMRTDLVELGGFDETFDEPAYYSDNDLCFRARLNGMTLREVPVGLIHLTNGTAGPPDERIRAVTARNRDRFEATVRSALALAG